LEEEVPVLGEGGSSHMSLENARWAPYQKSQPPKKGLVAGGRSGSETDVTEFTSAIYVLIFLRFLKAFPRCLKKKSKTPSFARNFLQALLCSDSKATEDILSPPPRSVAATFLIVRHESKTQ
jgi:hypothetical protein